MVARACIYGLVAPSENGFMLTSNMRDPEFTV
ncbi:hypothetical protein Vi05172_g6070 [Venturia inaequalis]|nr:hypothetical protein Vi05172_g6070 [Venturia inaequalis]